MSGARARAVFDSLRVRQWAKNGALLAPLVFAQRVGDPRSVVLALSAVGAFCLLASAAYVGNDIADRDRDREHLAKRDRPVASGDLPLAWAAVLSTALAAAGLSSSFFLGPAFVLVAAGYLLLQVLYTVLLKHVVLVDVFAIAGSFVLRVIAGAVALDVPISNWLYLCTLLLSLFLALSKRRAELVLLAGDAGRHRWILAEYSVPLMDQLVGVVSACTVLAYALYTLSPDTIQKFGTDRLKFTIPFVLFGLFRYLYLAHRRGEGDDPAEVLLRDRPTQLNLLAYLATVAWAIYTRA